MSCTIEGCSNPLYVKKRGLCLAHYLRWYKYGDPEFFPEPRRGSDAPSYKHGAWGKPVFGIWKHMISRCYNPANQSYQRYGARGIKVCERWRDDYFAFEADMGPRPEGMSIDRIDNDRGYEPGNCRWATDETQGRNRRCVKLTKEKADEMRDLPRRAKNGRGPGYSKAEIAEMYGVSVATVKKVLSGDYWK